jgi:hypothetical protein
VPNAGHGVVEIIDAPEATTWIINRGGTERVAEGAGPSWDEIDRFIHTNLNRAR